MARQNVEVLVGHAQNISIKYSNNALINTEVFPMVDLQAPTQKITRYNRGEQFQTGAHERQPGTEIRTTKTERNSIQPQTVQYAASDFITREDLRDQGLPANQSPPLDLVQDIVEKNAKDLDLRREIAVADHIFAATWEDGNSGGKDQAGSWLTPSTSTFRADFDVALKALKNAGIGRSKLRLALDFGTFLALDKIDDIREQLKYTSSDSLTEDMLAKILKIDKVIVGDAIQNVAPASALSDAFTGNCIWEKTATKGSAFLYHFEKPGIKTMNAGVQPRSKLDNKQHRITETYWDFKKKAHFYDSMEETDIITTSTSAGYLWVDTILS